jgi:hypothetical protein
VLDHAFLERHSCCGVRCLIARMFRLGPNAGQVSVRMSGP